MPRFLTAALLAALGTVCAFAQEKVESKDDPKSDNKGKIVGKWKVTEYPKEHAPAYEQITALGFWFYIEFKSNNILVLGLGADTPEGQKQLKRVAENAELTWDAKYRLLAVDVVEIYGAKEKKLNAALVGDNTKPSITVKKDEMTIKDPDGNITKLTRLKEPKDKPEK